VLTGAAFASHLNTLEDLTTVQNVGHVLAAVRTDLFVSDGEFRQRMDEILAMLRASPPGPGIERVLVPGEIELAHESRLREHGIPLPAAIVSQLTAYGDSMDVPFPAFVAGESAAASARS
jgi:ureidoglycolate dehydrogenase (NAD+)